MVRLEGEGPRNSLIKAQNRRDIAKEKAEKRRRLRLLFLGPMILGAAILATVVTYDGTNMLLQGARVLVGTALVLPWLTTFTLGLGHYHDR